MVRFEIVFVPGGWGTGWTRVWRVLALSMIWLINAWIAVNLIWGGLPPSAPRRANVHTTTSPLRRYYPLADRIKSLFDLYGDIAQSANFVLQANLPPKENNPRTYVSGSSQAYHSNGNKPYDGYARDWAPLWKDSLLGLAEELTKVLYGPIAARINQYERVRICNDRQQYRWDFLLYIYESKSGKQELPDEWLRIYNLGRNNESMAVPGIEAIQDMFSEITWAMQVASFDIRRFERDTYEALLTESLLLASVSDAVFSAWINEGTSAEERSLPLAGPDERGFYQKALFWPATWLWPKQIPTRQQDHENRRLNIRDFFDDHGWGFPPFRNASRRVWDTWAVLLDPRNDTLAPLTSRGHSLAWSLHEVEAGLLQFEKTVAVWYGVEQLVVANNTAILSDSDPGGLDSVRLPWFLSPSWWWRWRRILLPDMYGGGAVPIEQDISPINCYGPPLPAYNTAEMRRDWAELRRVRTHIGEAAEQADRVVALAQAASHRRRALFDELRPMMGGHMLAAQEVEDETEAPSDEVVVPITATTILFWLKDLKSLGDPIQASFGRLWALAEEIRARKEGMERTFA